jgi:diguanylate cyclase (GGDEF)-like protein
VGNYQNLSRLNIKYISITRILQSIILLAIIIVVTYTAYKRYTYVLTETTSELSNKVISYYLESFENFSKKAITLTNGNLIKEISSDEKLKKELENMLQLIRTSTIQNLFVIFREPDKNYYFLLDSDDNPNERAEIFQPFEPASDVWNHCYETSSMHIHKHKKNTNLWITVAVPLIENNSTVAILGADISYILDEDMQLQLQNFGELFFWISLLSISWFALLYLLVLYFRRKYHEGYIDPLTTIFNRRYLYDVLLDKLAKHYQLIMIDIDYFKKVNDTYGHAVGDEVLKIVATRIKETIRPDDILIRFGGEEFLLYIKDLDAEQSLKYAERIRTIIADSPIYYNDITCNVTISLGVNPYGSKFLHFKDMVAIADEALYKSKAAGRDTVTISSKPL